MAFKWLVQHQSHNINKTERGGVLNEVVYHYERCIVKALCNSGGHLFRNLVWTAAEGKSNCVI